MSKLSGANGGGWTQESYNKFHSPNFNTGMSTYIADAIHPSSVLEIGSGLGYVAKYLNDYCCQEPVHCIEPNNITGVYDQTVGPILYSFDVCNDQRPAELCRKYDLVLSIEMAEHVERDLHTQLFDFLVGCTRDWVVFSGGRIGQPGHGHIACRNELDWRSEFLDRGMVFQSDMTDAIRASCNERNKNHQRNLQVFRKEQ